MARGDPGKTPPSNKRTSRRQAEGGTRQWRVEGSVPVYTWVRCETAAQAHAIAAARPFLQGMAPDPNRLWRSAGMVVVHGQDQNGQVRQH